MGDCCHATHKCPRQSTARSAISQPYSMAQAPRPLWGAMAVVQGALRQRKSGPLWSSAMSALISMTLEVCGMSRRWCRGARWAHCRAQKVAFGAQ